MKRLSTPDAPGHTPNVVVVPHHVDALGVRQVAVLYEQAQDAAAAEAELLPDDALQVRHHAARVHVHEQPTHPAAHDGRWRVVKKQAQANELATVSSHDAKTLRSRHALPGYTTSALSFQNKTTALPILPLSGLDMIQRVKQH